MTGQVYTVAGGKGGVGKTTTVINVAVALQEGGHDVAVVDADLGMANLGAMLDIEQEPTLHQVLAGEAAVSDALAEGPGGITVLPGERDLQAYADADPAKLRKVIDALASAYEVVLVDTGAGLSHEVTVPLGLADGVVLATTADDVAIGDAVKTVELAERIGGDVIGAVLTRAGDDTDVSAVADELDLETLAVVPEDEGATADEPLVLSHPDSNAAEAYRRLADALEGIDATTRDTGEAGNEDVDVEDGDAEDAVRSDETDERADAESENGGDEEDEEDEIEDAGDEEDEEDESEGGGVLGLFKR